MEETNEMEREEKAIRGTKIQTEGQERVKIKAVSCKMGSEWREMGILVKHKWEVILFLSTTFQEQNPDFLGTSFQRFMLMRTSPPRRDHCSSHAYSKKVSILWSPTIQEMLTNLNLYF